MHRKIWGNTVEPLCKREKIALIFHGFCPLFSLWYFVSLYSEDFRRCLSENSIKIIIYCPSMSAYLFCWSIFNMVRDLLPI